MKIVSLKIVLQSRVSKRARKDVIRRGEDDGPFRNREVIIDEIIEAGPGSNANAVVRNMIARVLSTHKQGEVMFYVVAEFDRGTGLPRDFKTIVPRSKIPF